jgi:hypothetical protein
MTDAVAEPTESGRSAPARSAADVPAPAQFRHALADLRQARAARRTAQVDRFDVFYRAYLASLIGAGLVLWAAHVAGGHRLALSAANDTVRHAPAVCGLITALVVAIALRSGSRGGPIVVEAADVRHVLSAPLPRRVSLRGPALRQLRFLGFAAAVLGAIGGLFLARRAGGPVVAWIVCDAAWAVLTLTLALTVGWLAAGHRLAPWAATALGAGLSAWSVAAVAWHIPGPFIPLGRLAVWPAHVDLRALIFFVAIPLLGWLGLRGLDGVSLESLERRSALVGQLRFAATVRDLRPVLGLRRQLTQERARAHPWLPAPSLPSPAVTRGLRSALRTPVGRLGRTLLVALAAAAAAWAAWTGITPLVAVAGVAGFVAGLDVVEPLAEELDHPTVLELAPVVRDHLLSWHLVVPALQLLLFGGLAVGAVAVAGVGGHAVALAAAVALSGVVCGLAGAAVSTVKGTPDLLSESTYNVLLPPEAASAMLLYRTALPPAIAIVGFVPLLVARHVATGAASTRPGGGTTAAGGATVATAGAVAAAWRVSLVVSAVVAVGLVGWLLLRESIHRATSAAMGGTGPSAGP